MSFRLGINNCFAVKRWPQPDEWAAIVVGELGLDLVQHSLDLVDLGCSDADLRGQAERVREACRHSGLQLHSTFTGLAAYSSNLLLDPDPAARGQALAWYERVIRFSAAAGARAAGGHVGSLSVREFADARRRHERWSELIVSLDRLRRSARGAGLERLLVENMACAREPSTIAQVRTLLARGDADRVPVELCLDIGHQCVPGTDGEDRDPYAWLRRLGDATAVVHLQQSDAEADHHWPFTAHFNAVGRIEAGRVLEALGDARPALVIEVIPSFEADDAQMLEQLRESVAYWRAALDELAGPAGGPSCVACPT
ncbi:MAG: sugar phosphate isomerase/epimerase family protein [Solirubrobacteraceae bacterium]